MINPTIDQVFLENQRGRQRREIEKENLKKLTS